MFKFALVDAETAFVMVIARVQFKFAAKAKSDESSILIV